MIVRPDKSFERSSAFLNNNPYPEQSDNLIIDETTDEGQVLAAKVMATYPYFDLIVKDGKLVDIVTIERPSAEKKSNDVGTLKQTIDRLEKRLKKVESKAKKGGGDV
jgi:hypothetical protein